MRVLKIEMGFPRVVNLLERQYVKSDVKATSVLQDICLDGKAGKLIIGKETYSQCVSVKNIQENCGISSLAPSSTQDMSFEMDFLSNKCGLTDQDLAMASKLCNGLRHGKSGHKLEEALELLTGCGLTADERIRRVVLWNPSIFLYKYKRILKSRISFLTIFVKEEDITKLFSTGSKIFNASEDRLKFTNSLLQRLGGEGDISEEVARVPCLITSSEEKVMESFKQAEDLGLKKASKIFASFLLSILGVGKESLDQKLQCLSSLGFSEEQVSDLSKLQPWILGFSEEKLKRNVDFLINSVGLALTDLLVSTSAWRQR